MAEYKVVEIFTSINGEGMRAGELAVFIRLQGCNLNCSFCDTMWANEADAKYTMMTEQQIYDAVLETEIQNVTLTGGEPLWQKDIGILIQTLTNNQWLRLEIETNGSVSLEEFMQYPNRPVFTMDYKLPGSGMESRMNIDNFAHLEKTDTVKFVVSDRTDLDRAKEMIQSYILEERCHVIFSPVFGAIELDEIVEYMKEYKLNNIKMQIQMHKVIWNPNERGV